MRKRGKRKFDGDYFTPMAVRKKKKDAQSWAASARKPPHNARARVVKMHDPQRGTEYYVYVHGYRKRR